LEDVDGTSLARVAKPLAYTELTRLALELARAVAGMHGRGVMHRNITPANILVSGHGRTCVVNFALATWFAEIRPEFTHHNEIVGTLAYLAPEQTGRTGRSVDQRADLYALGATLYELATGEPPFGTGDALRLIHDHLAREPVPPAEVNSAIPEAVSDIIMHLLEKEPDNRYRTAEGLIQDLEWVRDADARAIAHHLRVGVHDFAPRLLSPSRLVGRDAEIAALRTAFDDAMVGRCRGVLVSGASGVGKTALIDELRPVVTRHGGWFVTGKFDQYRRDIEFDGAYRGLRALGRLLLAEPDDALAGVRQRLLTALGQNTGLAAAALPEFAALLNVPPDPGDPLTLRVRSQRVAVELLRAVASPQRPVVFFIDDVQWAGRTTLDVIDILLGEEQVDGLLLAGAYRDDDLEVAHPLTSMVPPWEGQGSLRHLRLDNLPQPDLVTMVAEMLHLDPATAAGLAEEISQYTHGNPYVTVELLNALRHDGLLTPTADGWRWDQAAIHRRYLGEAEVATLLAARIDAMPPECRAMLEAMACLGGRTELSLLQAATAEPASVVEQRLAPALDDEVLMLEPGVHEAVRFRHDRIREVILDRLDTPRRRTIQLAMARRFAAVPELFAVAAQQYLPVVDAVHDAAERQMAGELLRRAADQAMLIGEYRAVSSLLAAAVRLTDPAETATLIELHTGRMLALFNVGRLDEADEEYQTIEGLSDTAMQRADATSVQVSSLASRNRHAEAIRLGIETLRELGIAVPSADRITVEVDLGLDMAYRWLEQTDQADELTRPDIDDPRLLAAANLIYRTLSAAYFGADHATFAWCSLAALRILIEYGPGPTLVGPASMAARVAIVMRGDYRCGYRISRRVLALGEARGYEPATSVARYIFALARVWFDELEHGVDEARKAREGLIRAGYLADACDSYHATVGYLLDCAPSVDDYVHEVEAGLSFRRRTGTGQVGELLDDYRWLASVLRGESSARAREGVAVEGYADKRMAFVHASFTRALAAAIFGDLAALDQHTAAAMPLLPSVTGDYTSVVVYVLRGLALAGQAHATHGDERNDMLSELDDVTRWLGARAADAPANFLHLLRWVEAERAWASGDFRTAVQAFDAARREVAARQRPWHRAMITEHAARFYLAHGVDRAGYDLLAEARQEYLAWGATAKVDQLDWAYPTVRPQAGTAGQRPDDLADHRFGVTTGAVDLLGILAASQALSSETSLDRLHARVVEVLGAMTGATRVRLLLWSDDRQDWLPPPPDSGTAGITEAGRERAVPMSVLRYTERMGELLVVNDAVRDDRFARDPYFADVDCCSLLAVPIVNRGRRQALLLLENRLIRGAFSSDRLDGIKFIAGQLAVSLENAEVYASLEGKVAERTHELALANTRLEEMSVTDPLTGLANRRRLDDVLSAEGKRGQRTAAPLALAMIDIDHFKFYNDHYGHAAGDRCLQRVAAELGRNIRGTDLIARYGGEEFAVVMPGTDIIAAVYAADRLRRAVVDLAVPHVMAKEQIVTVSIGVTATVPAPDRAVERLVEVADVQLYRAKRSGRNCVRGAITTAPTP
jgi:diguanylate cyclase (GGDEF)-like protein